MHLITLTFLFLLGFKYTNQCETTFKKTPVLVEQSQSSNFQIVTGCITSKKLKYNSTQLKGIKIIGQYIGVLREGAVSKITESFQLSFYQNNISVIQSQAFEDLPGLSVINMDENEIEEIQTNVFDSLPHLEVVNLEKNKLELLMQHTFANLPNLTMVSLDDNRLKTFNQDWFFNTPQLKLLFINSNLITSLSKAMFVALPSLENLSLFNNSITYVHKNAFLGLNNLIELDLGYNQLKAIMVNFKANPNLRHLDLHHNRLNYIPEKMLEDVQHSLKEMWIFFNPWQCSCLDKYIEWSDKHKIKMSWQCKNTNLACILPKTNIDMCIPRSSEDFYSGGAEHFSGICKKQSIL